MLETITAADIAHVIQLSVAPVFLLAGIGSILGVMANRLARVVDRARILEGRMATTEGAEYAELQTRLLNLGKRAGLIKPCPRSVHTDRAADLRGDHHAVLRRTDGIQRRDSVGTAVYRCLVIVCRRTDLVFA